jgi:acetyl-CoA carboxylase biotin carboxyl carrier protein
VWDETLERVRSAAEFCVSAGLTRFRIDEGDFAIEVRRTPRAAHAADVPLVPGDATESVLLPSNGSLPHEDPVTTLKADFVGIVRFSRPTVAVGSIVPGDRELAYVESLGIRNPIRSGGPCRIAEMFVSDGEPVGFGQPLIAIEPQRV